MIDADCPACGRVLVTVRRVLRVERRAAELVVALRCWCAGVAVARVVPRRRRVSAAVP
jgi:hypothetical protein